MVLDCMKNIDVLFLSETWLRPCELHTFNTCFKNNQYWCNLKSSMDPEVVHDGRPFGGVGFVCKKLNGVSYIPIKCESDRISGIQLTANGKIILTIIGVYLPYFNGKAEQAALYSETLEQVQSLLDTLEPSPTLFMSDMNAGLSQQRLLPRKWYKQHSCNDHSLLLYDFVSNNDLVNCNFSFTQKVNYTYTYQLQYVIMLLR